MRDHLMGYLPALPALDPEPRKECVTPAPVRFTEAEQVARRLLDAPPKPIVIGVDVARGPDTTVIVHTKRDQWNRTIEVREAVPPLQPSGTWVPTVGDRVIPKSHDWRESWGPGTVQKFYDFDLVSVVCDSVKHHFGSKAAGAFNVNDLEPLDTTPAESPSDGWVPWAGGKCPVPRALVAIRMRAGMECMKPVPANEYYWHDTGRGGDIVAY